MEIPLSAWQFFQLALVLGLPVHAALAVLASLLVRARMRLSRLVVSALLPCWFVASVVLQVGFWWLLPSLPEPAFMLLGFVNLPALLGAIALMSVLLVSVPRRQRSAMA